MNMNFEDNITINSSMELLVFIIRDNTISKVDFIVFRGHGGVSDFL